MRGVRLVLPSRSSASSVAAAQNRLSLCSSHRFEALGAAAGPVRARGGGCRVFHCGLRHSERERIANGHAAVDGPVLHILAEQQSAALRLGGADDQAVPPAQTIAPFDIMSPTHRICINDLRIPTEQALYPQPSVIWR